MYPFFPVKLKKNSCNFSFQGSGFFPNGGHLGSTLHMMPAGGYAGHHPQLSGGACPIPKEKPYIDKAFLLQ